ncbi:2-hydroxy-3-oxopropionate reductase [Duganella sp. 1411]|uniref:NAD(P)-dependent oxidoreductase n=1 Tax=Duganella sp. 1411 TaxID=2806572 RepID=UPI001AEA049D|nr:NAD(P)-dependent oxidoreductase [Duganella sp. 1411]MBP1208223.1 2-hydroxy-3-oxopropionate reductase [Duganella sp. 1411]
MRIVFLGIGLMGEPMVRRLLAAGHAVTVWNRTYAKAEALAPAGALPVARLHEAVRDAGIVISMLEAGPIVEQVMRDALPVLAPNALWVDMSSTRQSEAQAFHALLRSQGRRFVDAPVSGGVAGAAAGTLAIMAGGDAADFAEVEPVLAAMGRATLVGPAGSGQVAKLCNQLIVGATINIVAEAMLLAQAAGADPAAMRAAIRGGFAESKILEVHGQRMLERNFVAGGKVATQLKDQRNILAAAEAAGVTLPVTELVTERYRVLAQTLPQADHSAALVGLERLNPGQRVGDAPDQV